MGVGPFTGRRKIADAKADGGRNDKMTPGTSVFRISRGFYTESKQVSGAEYFGIEASITHLLAARTAEENKPYEATRSVGSIASWSFNLNNPNQNHQYLTDGNVKNLCKAIMETYGFQQCFGFSYDEDADGDYAPRPDQTAAEKQLWADFEEVYAAWDEKRDMDAATAGRCGIDAKTPDPFGWVGNELVYNGGERFSGLSLRGAARDARGKENKANNTGHLFCAVTCYPLTEEEHEQYYPTA